MTQGRIGITRANGTPNSLNHLARVNTIEENTKKKNQRRRKSKIQPLKCAKGDSIRISVHPT